MRIAPLIAALAFVLAAALPAQLTMTRRPSVWEVTDSSFLVYFKTFINVKGWVDYGTDPTLGKTAGGEGAHHHEIRITDLDPDRYYYYRVRLQLGYRSPIYRTRTFPRSGAGATARVSFFVMGDCGAASLEQRRVHDLLQRYSFDLGLLPGDIVYPEGQKLGFDTRFYWVYEKSLHGTPFYPALGNHDVKTDNGGEYLKALHLPTANSGTERWYSFDHGGVHFIGLDSTMVEDATQTAWLRQDLARARSRGARWIFAHFHHPPYSSGPHGRNGAVFARWCPIFEEFEVDAVFCGHDHLYERSTVRRDYHQDKRGVTYFVAGTGGAFKYAIDKRQPHTAFVTSRYGFLRVDVRGDVMRTSFVDASLLTLGDEIDAFTHRRGPVRAALWARGPHPEIGQTFRGLLEAPAGSRYALWFAPLHGYFPLPRLGLFHLAIGANFELGAGVVGTGGTVPFALPVPPVSALRGADLFFQAAALQGAVGALTDLLPAKVR